LFTTICDMSCWSVTIFQTTPEFIILCKYIQNISFHHMELIYVESQPDRQTDRTPQLQTAITDTGEMSVDSPQVHHLLKKMT